MELIPVAEAAPGEEAAGLSRLEQICILPPEETQPHIINYLMVVTILLWAVVLAQQLLVLWEQRTLKALPSMEPEATEEPENWFSGQYTLMAEVVVATWA
jgi:hypothetical protein